VAAAQELVRVLAETSVEEDTNESENRDEEDNVVEAGSNSSKSQENSLEEDWKILDLEDDQELVDSSTRICEGFLA